MKFTSFQPLILTKDADAAVALFEALGFEKRHNAKVVSKGKEILTVCMKSPDGFRVDVTQIDGIPQDMTLIRMNVDNFQEAYDFLISKGFVCAGEKPVETETNISCMMRSPSGFAFDLCHHIKK